MPAVEEIVATVEHLERTFEDLVVRGLMSAGNEQLTILTAIWEEFERIGANHLASRIAALIEAIRAGDRGAGAALMRAQASLRVFERLLTLETATAQLGGLLAGTDGEQKA